MRSMVKAAMGVPEITSKVLSLLDPAAWLSEAAISPDVSAMVAEDARKVINRGIKGMKGEPKEEEKARASWDVSCAAKKTLKADISWAGTACHTTREIVDSHTQSHARPGGLSATDASARWSCTCVGGTHAQSGLGPRQILRQQITEIRRDVGV